MTFLTNRTHMKDIVFKISPQDLECQLKVTNLNLLSLLLSKAQDITKQM